MISLRFLACTCLTIAAVAACSPVPNDVNPGQQTLDQRGLQGRQGALNGQISTAVIETPSAPGGVSVEAGATGDVTFLDPNDLAARAEGVFAVSDAMAVLENDKLHSKIAILLVERDFLISVHTYMYLLLGFLMPRDKHSGCAARIVEQDPSS